MHGFSGNNKYIHPRESGLEEKNETKKAALQTPAAGAE
jgi:hypothetical protein